LDAELRDWIAAGNYNPGALQQNLVIPDFISRLLTPEREWWQTSLDYFVTHLNTIRAAAPQAQIVMVSMPGGALTNRQRWLNAARFGNELPATALTTTLFDDFLVAVAAEAHLNPPIIFTAAFRQRLDETLFFPFDGHMNAAGVALVATEVTPALQQACTKAR
jgi:hypothetical protein